MGKIKVSGKILQKIKENSDDANMSQFITNLCFEEAQHPGQWKWKEEYQKILEKYVEENEVVNENH
jgi:hypothetical protein